MRGITMIVFVLLYGLCSAQCPEDPDKALLNTQEKYDYFMTNYPNCDEYSIVKYDNKFIGDPRYTAYSWTLVFSLIAILIALKSIFYYRSDLKIKQDD